LPVPAAWRPFVALFVLLPALSVEAASGATIHSASELDYPPFAVVTAEGRADGFAVQLLRAAAAAMGHEVTFRVGPWHEIKEDLAQGRLDALPLVARTAERAQSYDFTFPYLSMHGAVVVRRGDRRIGGAADLAGKKVLVMRGDIAEEYVRDNRLSERLITTESLEEALRRLASGEGDAMVVQGLAGRKLIRELGLDLEVVGAPLPHYQDFCFAVRSGDKALLAVLNEGLALVIADGTFDRLSRQWLGPILEERPLPWLQVATAVALSLLFAAAIAWLWHRSLVRQVNRRTAELGAANRRLAEEIGEREAAEADLQRHRDQLESLVEERTAALEERSARYELVLAGAQDAIWDWDVPAQKIHYSSQWKALRDLAEDEVSDSEDEWCAHIHPDDAPRVRAAIEDHFAGRTPVFAEEYRIRCKDGSWKWVSNRGLAQRDPQGRVVRMAGSENDITERRRAEEELRESARQKDEFLAILAHELRNPLAPISNAVELLKLSDPAEPTVVEARDMIDRQVTHMVRLIDDLLDMSRITRGKMRLRRERVEIGGLLEQVAGTARPQLQRHGHELIVTLPPKPVYLDADPVRLAQVFSNLLHNACKYTPQGGHIHLSAEGEGENLVVGVSDNGIGIRAEDLPRLFELFAQVDAGSTTCSGGLGIGLALSRQLVEMHGGSIEARSEGPGKGSEFRVSLPLLEHSAADTRPSAGEAQTQPGTAQRILVVDDDPDIRRSLAMLLRHSGHEVESASDGAEAVELAGRSKPDVVLLDVGLPGLDGYAVCRRIREQPWGKRMHIIALTGWGQDEDRRKTREAGFDDHLVKPVEFKSIQALLSQAHEASEH
jgi:PAS domain S-box-containing protein